MMELIEGIGIVLVSYIVGSVPFGWVVVKLFSGKDIRDVASGRTGGTNAMRAAGVGAGILTAVLDALKAFIAVSLAKAVTDNAWIHILSPLAAILGHNYSIFLPERDEKGRLHLRGGAGGAPSVGGSLGLWLPSVFIIVPVGVLVFYGIGYASVTTMSLGLAAAIIFVIRAWLGLSPWQYALFGIIAEIVLVWALRPNIRRLLDGTERLHGWRAKRRQQKDGQL